MRQALSVAHDVKLSHDLDPVKHITAQITLTILRHASSVTQGKLAEDHRRLLHATDSKTAGQNANKTTRYAL